MYYNFICLKDAPLHIQEAVENMHMIANGEFYYDDIEVDDIADSFEDNEKLLADVMTMEYKDEKALLLFKMVIYRFCEHIPNIVKRFKTRNKKELFCDQLGVCPEDLKQWADWEEGFWRRDNSVYAPDGLKRHGLPMEGTKPLPYYRKRLREQKPVKKTGDYYYRIENVMESAFKDEVTIENVRKLQLKYEPFVHKAEKINMAITQSVGEQKDNVMLAIQNMKKVADAFEKNIQGELTAGDVMELERLISEWKEQIQIFNYIL